MKGGEKLKERIKRIRRELELTQQEFADRLGIKRGSIANYEIGRNDPVDSIISLICREFNVNEEWLRYGEGEMFNPAPTDALDQLSEKYRLSNADYVMIEKFVNLRPEVRQNIYDYFKEVVSAFVDEDSKPHEIASLNCNPDKSWKDIVIPAFNESLEVQPQEKSVEELEDEYKKSRSASVQKKKSSVLNTIAERNTEKSKKIHKKASSK